MLADGILPTEASHAFGLKSVEILCELLEKKYKLDCLGITSPSRGRKTEKNNHLLIIRNVASLKLQGHSATDAYRHVAQKQHKSEDTIRRIYERHNKDNKNRRVKPLP